MQWKLGEVFVYLHSLPTQLTRLSTFESAASSYIPQQKKGCQKTAWNLRAIILLMNEAQNVPFLIATTMVRHDRPTRVRGIALVQEAG